MKSRDYAIVALIGGLLAVLEFYLLDKFNVAR